MLFMDYNNAKTNELYVNFLWSTVKYWQDMAAETKETLDSYRALVDALIKNDIISEEELLTIWDEVDEGLYEDKEGEQLWIGYQMKYQ